MKRCWAGSVCGATATFPEPHHRQPANGAETRGVLRDRADYNGSGEHSIISTCPTNAPRSATTSSACPLPRTTSEFSAEMTLEILNGNVRPAYRGYFNTTDKSHYQNPRVSIHHILNVTVEIGVDFTVARRRARPGSSPPTTRLFPRPVLFLSFASQTKGGRPERSGRQLLEPFSGTKTTDEVPVSHNNPEVTMATIAMSLMRMLSDGPDACPRGLTVSPTTAALWAKAFAAVVPALNVLLALSQAPPALLSMMATMNRPPCCPSTDPSCRRHRESNPLPPGRSLANGGRNQPSPVGRRPWRSTRSGRNRLLFYTP